MERENNKKKRVLLPSISTLTSESSSRKKRRLHVERGLYMTDALLLSTGLYGEHLRDPINHFPVDVVIEKANKNLHSWYAGQDYQSRYKMLHCLKCDVNLYLNCYTLHYFIQSQI